MQGMTFPAHRSNSIRSNFGILTLPSPPGSGLARNLLFTSYRRVMIALAEIFRQSLELGPIWVLYAVAFCHPDVRRDFLFMGTQMRWSSVAVVSFFTVASLAQCFTFNIYDYPPRHDFFPFARWAMFAEPNAQKSDPRIYLYDLQGITADGREVYLNPARLFFSPNAISLFSKTVALGDSADRGTPARRAQTAQLLRYYMEGLKKRFEASHPGEGLVKIALWRRTVMMKSGVAPPAPFHGPESVSVFEAEYPTP